MKTYFWPEDKDQIRTIPRAIAIGTFDGVHRGHQKIINNVLRRSVSGNLLPMAVTFDPHPGKVLKPRKFHPTILMSLEHRLRTLERLGIREALVIHFNKQFSRWSRENFLKEILLQHLGMRQLSVGEGFRFGHRGLGDIKFLTLESGRCGFDVDSMSPLQFEKKPISSTRIRKMIERGDLSRASAMLGRPVSVYGTVVYGRGRGKKLGFPTANLNPHHEALPPPGVYAARGFLERRPLKGVIHLGERPTFGDRQRSLETHFFNFRRDIYGRDLELFFVKKLRDIECFAAPGELAEAIKRDAQKAKRVLA